MDITTVVEEYEIFVWPGDVDPSSDLWGEIETWGDRVIQLTSSGDYYIGWDRVEPGTVLVRVKGPHGQCFTMKREEAEAHFKVPTSPLADFSLESSSDPA